MFTHCDLLRWLVGVWELEQGKFKPDLQLALENSRQPRNLPYWKITLELNC